MALNDWKHTGLYYWRNKKNNNLLQVGVDDGKHVVMLFDKISSKKLDFFNNKTRAIAFAKDYMRNH